MKSGGSRQGCQRLGRLSAVGRKRPRSPEARKASVEVSVSSRPAEAVVGRRETSGPPVTPQGALFSMRFRAAKVARASWEHTRCGCTQFDWVADVG